MNKRMTIDEYFMNVAIVASFRSTCPRRQTGAVLTDEGNKLLSIGYNGNPSGHEHCIDVPCPGADAPSGSNLDLCEAIHAEINAIGSCLNLREIHTCYTMTAPCVHCIKALLATNCRRIVFLNDYPHSVSKELWEKSGRKWDKFEGETKVGEPTKELEVIGELLHLLDMIELNSEPGYASQRFQIVSKIGEVVFGPEGSEAIN